MGDRERALRIPKHNASLLLEPTNGGWLIWAKADPGRVGPPAIPVTTVADLARIISEWATPGEKEEGD